MNINVQIEWIPNIFKVNKKTTLSNNSIFKYRDIISQWYKNIWIENQVYDYKISDISIDFLQFEKKILFVANFNLRIKKDINFSLFNNPPLDGNEDKIYIKNIGIIKIDSFHIKDILIKPII